MAGYSGTPLPRKLGFRPGLRSYLIRAPESVRAELAAVRHVDDRLDVARGSVDFVLVFARSRPALARDLERVLPRLAPDGALWLCWPKRSSGVSSDLGEREVRVAGLATGLVDVKVCAVSDTWSGLKFVRRRADRLSRA